MKPFRPVILMTVLMALAVPLALADPIDPRMVVGGSATSEPILGLTFQFKVNQSGGGFFDFANVSGINWTNLSLTTKTPLDGNSPITDLKAYNISSDLFVNNTIIFSSDFSNITILFFGTDPNHPGIPFDPKYKEFLNNSCEWQPPFGSHFYINLNNVCSDRGGWVPGATVYGAANVPEPGTLTLLLSGILAIGISVSRRRR